MCLCLLTEHENPSTNYLRCAIALYSSVLSHCTSVEDGWFLAHDDFWEGRWSILACSLVAFQSDFGCAHPAALWTDEPLGWGWSRCCSLILPPASFLCGSLPLCLEITTGFSHWWAPTVLVWNPLVPRLTGISRFSRLSLQLVFVTLFGAPRSQLAAMPSLISQLCPFAH